MPSKPRRFHFKRNALPFPTQPVLKKYRDSIYQQKLENEEVAQITEEALTSWEKERSESGDDSKSYFVPNSLDVNLETRIQSKTERAERRSQDIADQSAELSKLKSKKEQLLRNKQYLFQVLKQVLTEEDESHRQLNEDPKSFVDPLSDPANMGSLSPNQAIKYPHHPPSMLHPQVDSEGKDLHSPRSISLGANSPAGIHGKPPSGGYYPPPRHPHAYLSSPGYISHHVPSQTRGIIGMRSPSYPPWNPQMFASKPDIRSGVKDPRAIPPSSHALGGAAIPLAAEKCQHCDLPVKPEDRLYKVGPAMHHQCAKSHRDKLYHRDMQQRRSMPYARRSPTRSPQEPSPSSLSPTSSPTPPPSPGHFLQPTNPADHSSESLNSPDFRAASHHSSDQRSRISRPIPHPDSSSLYSNSPQQHPYRSLSGSRYHRAPPPYPYGQTIPPKHFSPSHLQSSPAQNQSGFRWHGQRQNMRK